MMEQTSLVYRVEHLAKQVKSGELNIPILQDVNVDIKRGESVAILGASGSGKTTLLTLLAGLQLPSAGNIYINEVCLNQLDEDGRARIRGEQIGFVFQSFELIDAMTALENVMLPLEIQYVSYREAVVKATTWLEKVGLAERLKHYPLQLSGGEQQRVAIARAFITHPQIILADELTGNLDAKTGERITDLLFSINASEQTTLILVTHDEALAARCDTRLRLVEGALTVC